MIGPSGSGKSTLLTLIGLLERPTSGEYRLLGRRIDTLDDDALTRARLDTLGFVFQFHHLIPAFDALENVAMPALIRDGRIDAAARARADALLEAVGLADARHRKPSQLSGGMQQRVAIARALMHDPPLVLADEPTGNLDRGTARQMFDLIERLSRERATAFVVVTHDLELAGRADRMLALREGRLGPA
jgi:lipoprotein-releasing system ATP-binding protein